MSLLAFAFSIAMPILEAAGVSPAFEFDVQVSLAKEFPSLMEEWTERTHFDARKKLEELRHEQAVVRARIKELRSQRHKLAYP